MKVTIANRSKVVVKSTFNGYDTCINPYVGCQMGCSYCYVRFSVKDKDADWGEFVRIREHISEKLPKELEKGYFTFNDGHITSKDPETGEKKKQHLKKTLLINQTRVVIGTMTDPYQPQELKSRITRKALEIITNPNMPQFKKVGIFTRSPLVLQDLKLIKKLPQARVHFTITPYPKEVMRVIEPISPVLERRWATVKALKEAGIRVHVNVAPVLPFISEEFIPEFVQKLAEYDVDEYFVDPMQPYHESFVAFKNACQQLNVDWQAIEDTMTNAARYNVWKDNYHQEWAEERAKHPGSPNQLPIWSDHQRRIWIDMRSGEQMSRRVYNES